MARLRSSPRSGRARSRSGWRSARPRAAVLGLVAREGVLVVGAGSLIGLALIGVAFQFMSGMIFAAWTLDPLTIAGVLGVFSLATLGASYLPGRRAARLDPMREWFIDGFEGSTGSRGSRVHGSLRVAGATSGDAPSRCALVHDPTRPPLTGAPQRQRPSPPAARRGAAAAPVVGARVDVEQRAVRAGRRPSRARGTATPGSSRSRGIASWP